MNTIVVVPPLRPPGDWGTQVQAPQQQGTCFHAHAGQGWQANCVPLVGHVWQGTFVAVVISTMSGTPVCAWFDPHVKHFDKKILERHSEAIGWRALPYLQQLYDAERDKISCSWMAHRLAVHAALAQLVPCFPELAPLFEEWEKTGQRKERKGVKCAERHYAKYQQRLSRRPTVGVRQDANSQG